MTCQFCYGTLYSRSTYHYLGGSLEKQTLMRWWECCECGRKVYI